MQVAILGFSLYLLGIAFAPIITPHLSERYGRQAVYLVALPIFAFFILGPLFLIPLLLWLYVASLLASLVARP